MTLVSVTDTTEEGVVLDDLFSLPYRIPPFNSLLSPESVKFAPVKAKISTTMAGSRTF
jgi:hypothetical protein